MDDGVAYMVMGEGGDGGQATQMVAVDNGDGTQQLAIPVMDPETGQETYMIIDPQTAQSIADGSGGQQFIMMPGGGVQMVETQAAPAPHVEEQLQMVMLPSGEQGLVVGGGMEGGILQDKNGIQYMVTSDGSDIVPQNGNTGLQTTAAVQYMQEPPAPSNGHDSSMIRIVGIQDKKNSVSVVKSVGVPAATDHYSMESDIQRQPVMARAPRKQSLGPMSDISQQATGVPPGLTGDLFKDTELVEAKVKDLCRKVSLSEQEKEKLRLTLMTKGLDAVTLDTGAGGVRMAARGRGRPRGRGKWARISRPATAKTIKCDQCRKEFPANVDESVLVHHIKTAHMVKPQETFTCDKCEKVLPTATALKYHTCADRFQCNECNKLFMQKSTLIQHQAVAHGPSQDSKEHLRVEVEEETKLLDVEKSKPKPEIVKKLADEWDEEDEEENEKRRAEEVVKQEQQEEEDVSETVPLASSSTTTTVPEPAERVEKTEDLDEDQIVADVDDILNDTEDLMGDLDGLVTGKAVKRKYSEISKDVLEPAKVEEQEVIKTLVDKSLPTVQCEECYELFETHEKLTWHSLNDH